MPSDETERILTTIHDDIKAGLDVNDRLRHVEIKQAEMGATVKGLDSQMRVVNEVALPSMEHRLVREIQDSRPKNVSAWVAVGVAGLAAVIGPILAVLLAQRGG